MTRGRAPRVRRSLPWMLAALLAAVMVLTPAGAFAASNNYTVKFAANGGAGKTANQSIARDRSVKLRANGFSRNAYVYTGWNTKANGKGRAYKNQAAVKNLAARGKTITLYAQWRKAKNYTVVFNANGGTGSTANQGITYNTTTKLRANGFSRALYTFTGWNTRADGKGKAYGNTAGVRNIAGEGKTVTLYAQWRAVAYNVVYDPNGGEGVMTNQIVTNGKSAKLRENAFSREDFAFAGWNTAADGTGTDYDDKEVLVEDLAAAGQTVTLYAQWRPTTYLVSFDANGGVGAMGARKALAGKVFRLPVTGYAKAGYRFEGWSTEPDGSGAWYENREIVLDDIAPAGGEVTLYAQWEPTAYLIAYDANGGEGTMDTHQASVGKRVRLSSMAFTYAGHSFTGWCTEPDGTGDWYLDGELVIDLAEPGQTATLYAQWQETSYTVAFDANGGTGSMADVTAQVGKLLKLPTVAFAREGYTFAGWNTAADGSGDAYDNKEVLIDALASAGETATLYAQWRETTQTPAPSTGTYTIAYDLNGADGSVASQTVRCGSVAKLAAAPASENSEFLGWNTAADGSGTAYDAKEVIVDDLAAAGETITLYAQWKAVSCTIVFDANGGEGAPEPVVIVPNAHGKDDEYNYSLEHPYARLMHDECGVTREGYLFAGWSLTPDGEVPVAGFDEGAESADVWIGCPENEYGHFDNGEMSSNVKILPGEKKTLYAIWSEPYVITIDGNGQHISPVEGAGNDDETVSLVYSSSSIFFYTFGEPTSFTRHGSGYEEVWMSAISEPYPRYFSFTPDGSQPLGEGGGSLKRAYLCSKLFAGRGASITLYAIWEGSAQDPTPTPATDAYTIAYDLNGAEGSVASQSVKCGSVTKIADAPTRANHEFLGWNTAADGSGTAYDAKEVIVDDLAAAGETITLYAQWKAVSCTIVFDANGGEGAPEPIVVDTRNGYMPNFSSEVWTESFPYISLQYCPGYGTSSFLHEPTREGYLFGGWAGEPEGTVSHINVQGLPGYNLFEDSSAIDDLPDVFYDDNQLQVRVVPGQTVTVYATWSQDPVTVIVDANGGSLYDVDDPDGEALSQCEYTVARTNPLRLPYVAEDSLLYLPNGKTYRVTSPSNGKTYSTEWVPLSPTPDDSGRIWLDSYYGSPFGGSIAELFPNAGSSVTLYLIWNERG